MNPNKKVTTSSFTLLYYRFRDSPIYLISTFLFIILACIVLLWKVVVPLTQQWFSIQKESTETQAKIAVVKNNIKTVQALSTKSLEEGIETTFAAVPADKDFFGIITAITDAAVKSGVLLGDFSFTPGLLATASADTTQADQPIDVSIPIFGNIDQVSEFLKEINEKLPLSEAESLVSEQVSSEGAKLQLHFPYKRLPLLTYKYTEPIKPFTEEELSLIDQLAMWRVLLVEQTASADASLPPPL